MTGIVPLTLPVVLGLLAIVVFITVWHELGHFVAAKLCRVPVKLIGVGIGPALWRFSLNQDVRLEVRAVPLGMAIGVIGRRAPDGSVRRSLGQDMVVAAGGPAASLLLGIACLVMALFASPAVALRSWLLAAGLISVLLTLLNLAPLPGLDGGHLFLLTLARLGWQLTPQQETNLHRTGFLLTATFSLVGLAVLMLLRG